MWNGCISSRYGNRSKASVALYFYHTQTSPFTFIIILYAKGCVKLGYRAIKCTLQSQIIEKDMNLQIFYVDHRNEIAKMRLKMNFCDLTT